MIMVCGRIMDQPLLSYDDNEARCTFALEYDDRRIPAMIFGGKAEAIANFAMPGHWIKATGKIITDGEQQFFLIEDCDEIHSES